MIALDLQSKHAKVIYRIRIDDDARAHEPMTTSAVRAVKRIIWPPHSSQYSHPFGTIA